MSSTPASSSTPPRPPRAAPVVPDYQVDRLIGRGSYGEVWLVHSTLGTRRAVKVVYRDSFDSERPYLRELAGIRAYEPVSSHESQVRVFHVGKNDEAGYFYYVMELADDAASLVKAPAAPDVPPTTSPADYAPATLAAWLKQRGRLPCAEALPIARSLASALDHLHGNGLVHRDIKPANIILVGGRPKLADIGLVTSATNADTLVGTTGFIPPEGPGTPAADLYSFGKVLYEAVTGLDRQEFPNLPENLPQLADRELLLELNEVVLKCCHQDPRERYASAADLLADVQRIEAGHSLRRDRARRRQLFVVACLALAVLGGFGLVHFIQPSRQARQAEAGTAQPPPTVTSPVIEPPLRRTNSLGMVFVPVPGLAAEFSIWETRVQDFRTFVEETRHEADGIARTDAKKKTTRRTWDNLGYEPAANHPVRVISWEDATAFCAWLTRRELASGGLRSGERYRLPTDLEWSWAAGLTNESGLTPAERHQAGTNLSQYYWGESWPPPVNYGNFSGEESIMLKRIPGYSDPFSRSAPVGSFPPERHGLQDLAGNVAEFVEDWLHGEGVPPKLHVARGASWESSGPAAFRVNRRMELKPHEAANGVGFRVVRAPVPAALAQTGTIPAPPRWTNSLGLVFVPVPGLKVEFCLWETRVQDFRVFVTETGHKPDVAYYAVRDGGGEKLYPRSWDEAGARTGADHPVRAISGADARAFCEWLTKKERQAGRLRPEERYRLPRDVEWSVAAGLTNEAGETVLQRAQAGTNVTRFYWGESWPPPERMGNFSGQESIMVFKIDGYADPYPRTAPVGSFRPERHGLFDLAGNVSEFCEDVVPGDDDSPPRQVARGGNWECSEPGELNVARRLFFGLREANVACGFRLVRAPDEAVRTPAK